MNAIVDNHIHFSFARFLMDSSSVFSFVYNGHTFIMNEFLMNFAIKFLFKVFQNHTTSLFPIF